MVGGLAPTGYAWSAGVSSDGQWHAFRLSSIRVLVLR
jgi:hypothetical protein